MVVHVEESVSTNVESVGELHIQESSAFPDEDDEGDVEKMAVSWRELTKDDQWYRVLGKRNLTTSNGEAKILNLKNRGGSSSPFSGQSDAYSPSASGYVEQGHL